MRHWPIAVMGLLLAATPAAAFDCAGLANATVAKSAIGLPTSGAAITSAAMMDDPANGHFCKLQGAIKPVDPQAPEIRFQLNLPQSWNGKALHIGGGGYDGSLVTAEQTRFPDPAKPTALMQGYASFGSDGGHQARPGEDAAAFALNKEALANYAGDQLKKTHDVALALIRLAYGKAPARMYFQGNSQGGHEAFTVLQRWPADYDGVIAVHPVYDLVALETDGVLVGQAIYNPPGAWIPPAKAAMVAAKVMAACDALDGLKDNIVSNVKACNAAFDPKLLRCTGADKEDCLTDAQFTALMTLANPIKLGVTLSGGIDTFAGWPVLEGADMQGRFNPFGATADKPIPAPTPSTAFLHVMGDQLIRFMLLGDAGYNTLGFVPAQHAAALVALSKQMDASNPDISAFQRRGGKLLFMHGTVDMAVTPHNSIAYYEKVKAKFGKGLDSFMRFYIAPGFGHGVGNFVVGWDSLGTLDAWVDKGVAPGPQIATDTNKATAGRTRPLCEYPAYPKYNGSDVNVAASFGCVVP